MKTLKQMFCLLALFLFSAFSFAQSEGVSIKTSGGAPDASAMLDVVSATKGLLIPRVPLVSISNTSSPVSSPATGLLVYNTTSSVTGGTGFYYFNGTAWAKIAVGNGGDLWNVDPLTTSSSGINRNGGTVTIGTASTSASSTTLNVFGPAVFYSGEVGGITPTTTAFYTNGIHLGMPWNYNSVNGGHWNEINTYTTYIDMQYATNQDVHIGVGGYSNLLVSGAVTPFSDSTMKKNISTLTGVLSNVLDLNAYTYTFKADPSSNYHIGVIAQQVATKFPYLVSTQSIGKPGGTDITKKTMDYAGLTAVLLQAIKEQQTIIDDLKTRLHAIDGH